MHAGQPSISREKVGLSCARSVISTAHVGGNDGSKFYSAACGRRNSLREGFFGRLSVPGPFRGGNVGAALYIALRSLFLVRIDMLQKTADIGEGRPDRDTML